MCTTIVAVVNVNQQMPVEESNKDEAKNKQEYNTMDDYYFSLLLKAAAGVLGIAFLVLLAVLVLPVIF